MGVRILASVAAVLGAAALTLACMIALVKGTIRAVSIDSLALRFLALAADLVWRLMMYFLPILPGIVTYLIWIRKHGGSTARVSDPLV